MARAFIIIDVQNDFCPGGALPVADGDRVIPVINAISGKFDKVIATQDWHPLNHVSFARNHGKKTYEVITVDGIEQVLWPDHCVPGTWGADFHKDLNLENVDLIIRKGSDPRIDSYSAFLENDRKTETGLHYYLKGLGIAELYLAGLATDYCVHFSARDALRLGFSVLVVEDAVKGIDMPPGSVAQAMAEMKKQGATIIGHESV